MFDARAAKALPPGGHLTVAGAPGLRLLATASTRTWVYRYRSPVDGKTRQIKLGRWPAMAFPAALAAWERMRADRDAGTDPAAVKRQRRRQAVAEARESRYTVRRACDDYLATYRGQVTPSTYHEAARICRLKLDAIADLPAAELTRAQAFDLLDGMRDIPVLASRLRQLLGAVWDRALDAGRLPPETPNWWRLILRGQLASRGKMVAGKRAGPAKRVLSPLELGALVRWLPNFSRDVEHVLTLYIWTCCRGGEIVAMERGEISDEADGLWWTIPRERLKMRRNPLTVDHRVPLVGRAEAIVRLRLAASDRRFLFASDARAGHMAQTAVQNAVWHHMPGCSTRPGWERARLPVTAWSPHDLRRTSRTLLSSLGCPTDVAEAILGHIPPGVQAIYNRNTYNAERRVWLVKLAEKLEALAAG